METCDTCTHIAREGQMGTEGHCYFFNGEYYDQHRKGQPACQEHEKSPLFTYLADKDV